MNNKRLTEIIGYYEKLSLETKEHKQEEKERINNSMQGKRKKYMIEMNPYENLSDPYDNNYSSNGSSNSHDELINLDDSQHSRRPRRITMSQVKANVVYYCSRCKLVFRDGDQFQEHITSHGNENSACFCKSCNEVFENDIDYYDHVNVCQGIINDKDEDNIPTDPNGEYECPTCHNKYSNAFFVGEHFMKAHNDYSVLCELDHVEHNGFPGFEILKIIDMIENANINNGEICEVCCFNYEENIFTDDKEITENDRSALVMKCCQIRICRDCIMHHIIESDSIICPFCRKDHTRTDWNYITFIEPVDVTDREKWLPWWEEHIEIFNYK